MKNQKRVKAGQRVAMIWPGGVRAAKVVRLNGTPYGETGSACYTRPDGRSHDYTGATFISISAATKYNTLAAAMNRLIDAERITNDQPCDCKRNRA